MQRLKFALLPLTVFVLVSMAAAETATVEVHRKNGGPNGYADIDEWHGENFHKLWCQNPGSSGCDWTTKPNGRLIRHADAEIAAGHLNGVYWEIASGIKYTVTWTATDIMNADIIETQETLGSGQ